MQINMEWYRVFYWTARLGGLTKAAEQLAITQPAVSHSLKQLERGLNQQLFFRTSKGVTLTAEGEALLHYVEQAMHLLQAGEQKLTAMQQLEAGELTIGAGDTLCRHFLLQHLEKFHAAYPGIRIRVTNRTTPETLALLKQGKIDFGIINLPATDVKVFVQQSISLQDCLVGGSAYREMASQGIALGQLQQLPLLLLEQGGSTRAFLEGYALNHGVRLQPEFELGSLDLLVQFVRSGFGVAFVTRNYIADLLQAEELFEIPLTPALPPRHVGIATLEQVPLSAAAQCFLAFLNS
ncbi:LysR family transcriptional regulator [Paenibacillus sp. IB182496]|uniref:LysR family transcriptional regulator n=1 Tax=Paenibacillus sabuli TaxID=2772509 RepID=A0A927BY60_9BACL|nr:LysR family transcriptional regulator [Paenibacillus sabuli]MBD2848061.1 LysR family transcriptional regulator [Paenibacillus sabuli]